MERFASRAFTFLEVMMVVVIISILAAVVIPQFGGVSDDAKTSAMQAGLGGVRSAIAGYRSRQAIAGTAAYPTLAQLTTANTVVQGTFPKNPFNGLNNVQAVSLNQANARTVMNEQSVGWNYYVNNSSTPPVAVFYCNSSRSVNVNGASVVAGTQ